MACAQCGWEATEEHCRHHWQDWWGWGRVNRAWCDWVHRGIVPEGDLGEEEDLMF